MLNKLSFDEVKIIGEIFAKVPIFKKLSGAFLSLIGENLNIINFEKGKTTLLQTDTGTDLYIILRGNVRVTFFSHEGARTKENSTD